MLLAIDSATRQLSLALHDGQAICAEMTWLTSNCHTVELMPAIQGLLKQATLKPDALRLLAVSQGPGSFNGLRIGVSAAKGMALALHLPLITIPTLEIVAAAQPTLTGYRNLVAVAQAGRGRVVAGDFRAEGERWITAGETRIIGWEALIESITLPTLIAGEMDDEGLTRIAEARASAKLLRAQHPAFNLRRAGFLAELAWERWRGGDLGDPAVAVPIYLHQPGVPHP